MPTRSRLNRMMRKGLIRLARKVFFCRRGQAEVLGAEVADVILRREDRRTAIR